MEAKQISISKSISIEMFVPSSLINVSFVMVWMPNNEKGDCASMIAIALSVGESLVRLRLWQAIRMPVN
jgi:hypothetical protein